MRVDNRGKIKEMYRSIITETLIGHNIKRIVCTDEKEHFFDTIDITNDGEITYTCYGSMKFDNLYCDYECDYARLLDYLESDLFLAERCGKTKHFDIQFNNQGVLEVASTYLVNYGSVEASRKIYDFLKLNIASICLDDNNPIDVEIKEAIVKFGGVFDEENKFNVKY